jgi:hypothetical protein
MVKMEQVKTYTTEKGGLVIVYKVTPSADELINTFYIVTFDDNYDEQAWGLGSTETEALETASREWNEKNGQDDNPFREILERQI